MFFVDFMIKSSPISNAAEWQELAFERKELAGDEKFFDLLEETLADRSEQAMTALDLLHVHGLVYGVVHRPAGISAKKMLECSTRIRADRHDQSARICPESYEHVTPAIWCSRQRQPGRDWIALLGLVIVLFIANAYMYRSSSSELPSLGDIIKASQ